MIRFRRWTARAAQGAIVFGFLTAFNQVNFNNILFSFLSSLLNLLIAGLLGGDLGRLGTDSSTV